MKSKNASNGISRVDSAGHRKPILLLVGPTAVGKTAFGIRLAAHLDTEIIGADSMQIYRFMDIGTGKPTLAERAQVVHHLVDFVHPSESYSAGRFIADAMPMIHDLHQRRKVPLIVGGTGLYIRTLTDGLFTGPQADEEVRKRLKELALKDGPNILHQKLEEVDPVSAKRIHPNDKRRLIRALEVHEITGQPISTLQEEQRSSHRAAYRFIPFGLTVSRNRLYTIIEDRVDRMIEMGLVDEVRSLLKMGIEPSAVSMQGLGYKEMIPVITGGRKLEEAIELLKKETRHFAKRQMTWFGADKRIQWIDIGSFRSRNTAAEFLFTETDRILANTEGQTSE